MQCYYDSARLLFFILSCFFLMIRRPPRSTHCISSAASDVYKRQVHYLHLFADVLVRHAIKMFVTTELHMTILHDRCMCLILDLKALDGQWRQFILLDVIVQFKTCVWTTSELSVVVGIQQVADAIVQFRKGEKRFIFQYRINPSVQYFNSTFNQ
eukprot:TRINITY_DN19703_c0_g1_i2.p2 TRINITY_DN19703_c0_g1~~TRINITY_DN19703_c0_g1_i2.p2  ORF type:complete len:155 (-),score=9.11 TRINITY_DN19703_c0_g1_i2:132-596(-)